MAHSFVLFCYLFFFLQRNVSLPLRRHTFFLCSLDFVLLPVSQNFFLPLFLSYGAIEQSKHILRPRWMPSHWSLHDIKNKAYGTQGRKKNGKRNERNQKWIGNRKFLIKFSSRESKSPTFRKEQDELQNETPASNVIILKMHT